MNTPPPRRSARRFGPSVEPLQRPLAALRWASTFRSPSLPWRNGEEPFGGKSTLGNSPKCPVLSIVVPTWSGSRWRPPPMRWRTPLRGALVESHANRADGSSAWNADSGRVPGGKTGARLSSEACSSHLVSLSRPATPGSSPPGKGRWRALFQSSPTGRRQGDGAARMTWQRPRLPNNRRAIQSIPLLGDGGLRGPPLG